MYWWLVAGLLLISILLLRAFRGSKKQSAVQNAFLAKYTYEQLTEEQREEVKKQTLDIMKRGGMLEEDFDSMSEMLKFSFFALSMAELNIRPALPKEDWHFVRNPHMALHNSEHAVVVIKHHLQKTHNISIDLKS